MGIFIVVIILIILSFNISFKEGKAVTTFDGYKIDDETTFARLKENINSKDNEEIEKKSDSFYKYLNTLDDISEKKDIISTKYIEDFNEVLKRKNAKLFKYQEQDIKSIKTNYWLIALIVILAGIIGGWVRTKYDLVKKIERTKEEVADKIESLTKDNNFERLNSLDNDEKDKLVAETKKNWENLNNTFTKSEVTNTNLLFGIIASSVSILVLKVTDSNVLEFNEVLDYFILWSWCVLGAIYAKSTLEKVYFKKMSDFQESDNS